ncbi:tetratricopeptide repeat protein [Kordiimonas laminariae]|uniref:tetratricopeptide repeat protein n=1 Tax=Kordiimonas laminariae TaxID=2917717 RepID=UPI001FF611D6|nr:hypothetical protein [Kordiimonas laminariae]MCK0069123.1 hypothetical protein [Kordiimonas laminariae]
MSIKNTLKSLSVVAVAAVAFATVPMPQGTPFAETAFAQEQAAKKPRKTRKVQAIPLPFQKKLEKISEVLNPEEMSDAEKQATQTERLARASQLLDDAYNSRGVNDYAKSIVWQYRAQIAFDREDTPGAINAFENVLKFKESIPVAQEHGIMYNLAQLYYSIENYDRALQYLKDWEREVSAVDPALVGVNQLVFISQVYYTLNEFNTAITYIDRAITDAEKVDTIEVKENWYGLRLACLWELKDYKRAQDTLITLIVNWPDPSYWNQLAATYQELGNETASWSILEAAYKQGFLDDKPAQIRNVAQIQIARDAPIKCAWIIEDALKEEQLERDAENLRTLGQCYMQAAEFDKAIAPLTAAAKSENDGDLWFQIGQVQLASDDLTDAVTSFDKANSEFTSSKDSKAAGKRFSTVMMKAQALIELKRFKEAKTAFAEASKIAKTSRQRRQISQWRGYLKAEEAREATLKG